MPNTEIHKYDALRTPVSTHMPWHIHTYTHTNTNKNLSFVLQVITVLHTNHSTSHCLKHSILFLKLITVLFLLQLITVRHHRKHRAKGTRTSHSPARKLRLRWVRKILRRRPGTCWWDGAAKSVETVAWY